MGEGEGGCSGETGAQDPQVQLLVSTRVSPCAPVSSSGTVEPEISSSRPRPQEACTPTRWRGGPPVQPVSCILFMSLNLR